MKVILKADIEGVGVAGEVVEVSKGYARNYLIPKGLAIAATLRSVKSIEGQKRIILQKVEKEKRRIEALAHRLSQIKVTITKPVGEGGKLYGAVTTREIADVLTQQGIEIDRRKLVLGDPIKGLGEHSVKVKLSHGIEAHIKVEVAGGE